MNVSYKMFNVLLICAAVIALAMWPAWPYSRWGYFPSIAIAIGIVILLMYSRLQRD